LFSFYVASCCAAVLNVQALFFFSFLIRFGLLFVHLSIIVSVKSTYDDEMYSGSLLS